MGHRYFKLILASAVLAACSKAEPPPVKTTTAYQDIILDAEAKLEAGNAVGMFYIHPISKYACKQINVRLSYNYETEGDSFWQNESMVEITKQRSAPTGRKDIGTHPVFFTMEKEGQYRIDAIECQDFEKQMTAQHQNFASFDAVPGQLSYVGAFTQSNFAEGVDFYSFAQDMEFAKSDVMLDSLKLNAELLQADVTPFTFTNFNGKKVSEQQLLDNIDRSADYFTLKQTLNTQANDALMPLLGTLPDLPDISIKVGVHQGSADEQVKDLLRDLFDVAFFRMDLQNDFHDILNSGKPYDVATEFIHMRLAIFNAKRRNLGVAKVTKAQKAYDSFLSKHRLKTALKDNISDERKSAREAWRQELDRMAFVLLARFDGSADVALRESVQTIMDDYIPAKYASLNIEIEAMAEKKNLDAYEMNYLRTLLQSAEENEAVVINELVAAFTQENLAENKTYHNSLDNLFQNWDDILTQTGIIQ